jgi:hypothetical protein
MIPSEPEPIEIECDAPPFYIVRGCEQLGFRTPQDVRWCHTDHIHTADEPSERTGLGAWKSLLGMTEPKPALCACRCALPQVEKYTFTLRSGGQVHYHLAQCSRCRTIYWREG